MPGSRRRPARRRVRVVGAAAVAAALPALATGAWAQPDTCPAPGPDAVRVTVTEPAPGTAVGGRVSVRGTTSSPVPVGRVELFVGEARRDVAVFAPPALEGAFELAWDAAGARGGPSTLRVVACGGGEGGTPLARGVASVPVDVRASPAPAPVALTPVTEHSGDGAPGGPLWVGAAVGLSALAGLLVAGGRRPRRPAIPRRHPAASAPRRRRAGGADATPEPPPG